MPWAESIRFVSSGTEAVMSALRVARAATGRSRVLKFDGCYHGHADGMLVKAGSGLAGQATASSAGVSAAVAGETLVVALDDEAALDRAFDAHGGEIAAAIVEPLPANSGFCRSASGSAIRAKAPQTGALLVFDEVISGFALADRHGRRAGIRPDLVTFGK